MDKTYISQQKSLIEKRISELKDEIRSASKYDDLGSNDEDNTREFEEFEEKNAVSREANREIDDLKCALARIDEGKYGICAQCNQPIETGRLKGYLGAIYCSTHAK
jgi:DnaK suppressor protein